MSSTPRTDAATWYAPEDQQGLVAAPFARKLELENAALRAAQQELVIVATMAKAYMDSRKYGHGIEDPLWHAARKALAAVEAVNKDSKI